MLKNTVSLKVHSFISFKRTGRPEQYVLRQEIETISGTEYRFHLLRGVGQSRSRLIVI
jgi:hypothetical protein